MRCNNYVCVFIPRVKLKINCMIVYTGLRQKYENARLVGYTNKLIVGDACGMQYFDVHWPL